MATVSKGRTFVSGETVTPAKLNELVDSATVSGIVNADIDAAAAIALSKLATGALPTAITVASANIVDGTIATGDIADGAITNAKLADGTVVQVVNAATTSSFTIGSGDEIPYDNTIPQNTEGEQILTASITPKSNTNKVLAEVFIHGTVASGGNAGIIVALFRGSGASAVAARVMSVASGFAGVVPLTFLDSPATASSVTYSVRCGYISGGFGWYVNANASGNAIFGGTLQSSITLTEVKAS